MPDMAAIAGMMGSIKAVKDITAAMVSIRDTNAFQEKQFELQSAAIDLQASVFAVNEERTALLDRNRELEAEIARLKNWEAEKQRYELCQTSSIGNFAYRTKPEMRGLEPSHYLCASCFTDGKKSVLQAKPELRQRLRVFGCPRCHAEVTVQYGLRIEVPSPGPIAQV